MTGPNLRLGASSAVVACVVGVLCMAQCSSDKATKEDAVTIPKPPTMVKNEPTSGELRYKKWCVEGMEVFEIGSGTGASSFVPHFGSTASNGVVVSCSNGVKK